MVDHDEVCRSVGANFVPYKGDTPEKTFDRAKKDAVEAKKYEKADKKLIEAIHQLTFQQYLNWTRSVIPRVMGKGK